MEDDGRTRPSLDVHLDTIAHVERRRLLVALMERQGGEETPVTFDEWWDDADSRETMAAMRHNHLPKLADRGVIRWDPERRRVRKGPRFGEVAPLVALLSSYRDELPSE